MGEASIRALLLFALVGTAVAQEGLVEQLNSEDWRKRRAARDALTKMVQEKAGEEQSFGEPPYAFRQRRYRVNTT